VIDRCAGGNLLCDPLAVMGVSVVRLLGVWRYASVGKGSAGEVAARVMVKVDGLCAGS
jgi:hypothetical protein